MAADEITFGVEIECTLPRENAPAVGGYHAGEPIADLPAGWNAQRDGSISSPAGRVGVEVVSPVLSGAEGVRQLRAVCEWLAARGAGVNRSTGLHVHVGVSRSPETLKRVVTAVANFEKAVYAATGTHAREQGHYCRPIQSSDNHREGRLAYVDRYHVLNVATRRPTVEFRAFAGTTSFAKIVAYVRLAVGMVEKALDLKRLPAWVAPEPCETSPIKRGGRGLTELNRLFYWLGWTKGRVAQPFGMVGAGEGPTVAEMKDELVRLARKYDAGE